MSRVSLALAAALLVCLPDSTPRARISCDLPSKSQAGGGIQTVLVLDGSPVHNAGNLRVHASNWGAIGSMPGSGTPYSEAPSAEWPRNSGVEYLFIAGLWVGAMVNGVPAVSTSAPQMEFRPSSDSRDKVYWTGFDMPRAARIPANPDDDNDGIADEDPLDGFDNDLDGKVDEDFAGISDQMMSRHFRDDEPGATNIYPEHVPMHLDVREESYAFADPDYDDFVGFTFSITNTGENTLNDVYIGLFADGDVGRPSRPQYWMDDATELASVPVDLGPRGVANYSFPYWRDADGDGGEAPGRCGFVLLDHTTDPAGVNAPAAVSLHSWATFRNGVSFAEGGDPTNDFERYQAMSSGVISAPITLGDVRSMMSVGPFPAMAPGQTLTFTVALVVTPADYSNVARAVEAYDGKWFDLDHNPATGVDGREHHEPWYLPTDNPTPLWIWRFEVAPDGSDMRLRWLVVTDQPLQSVEVKRALADGSEPVTLAMLPGTAREFVDETGKPGARYAYSVTVNGKFGTSYSSPALSATVADLPTKFWLAYPNPFRESTTISAHLAERTNMNLMVFDVAGRRVKTLASGVRGAGEENFTWNGTDDAGHRVPAGVYFCRLRVGDQNYRQTLVIMR